MEIGNKHHRGCSSYLITVIRSFSGLRILSFAVERLAHANAHGRGRTLLKETELVLYLVLM